MSSSGIYNEQLNKPTIFDLLRLQLIATTVFVTKAALQAITPIKQSPHLRHNYNMTQYCGNLYLVNPISNFRITMQDIQHHVQRMYGTIKHDNAPYTTHHVLTSPTSPEKATSRKKFQMLRLVPLDLMLHHHSIQLPPMT